MLNKSLLDSVGWEWLLVLGIHHETDKVKQCPGKLMHWVGFICPLSSKWSSILVMRAGISKVIPRTMREPVRLRNYKIQRRTFIQSFEHGGFRVCQFISPGTMLFKIPSLHSSWLTWSISHSFCIGPKQAARFCLLVGYCWQTTLGEHSSYSFLLLIPARSSFLCWVQS